MKIQKASVAIASAIAAVALLSACSTSSPVQTHLEDYWSGLSDSGRQQVCAVLVVKGVDWVAETGGEHGPETAEFLVDRCADVELDAADIGIPL